MGPHPCYEPSLPPDRPEGAVVDEHTRRYRPITAPPEVPSPTRGFEVVVRDETGSGPVLRWEDASCPS
jgi:hypothetical protein